MDIDALLNRMVPKAFALTASVLTSVTFKLREGESFNFTTASTVIATQTDVVADVFVMKTTHGLNYVRKQLLVQDVPNLDIFDRVLIGGETWRIGDSLYDNGYIQIIEVYNG